MSRRSLQTPNRTSSLNNAAYSSSPSSCSLTSFPHKLTLLECGLTKEAGGSNSGNLLIAFGRKKMTFCMYKEPMNLSTITRLILRGLMKCQSQCSEVEGKEAEREEGI